MEYGFTLTNPLLQVAVSAGESSIRHACGGDQRVHIHAEMLQFADGRDAIQITLQADDWSASFSMLLRNYFDRAILWRVARRAYLNRKADPSDRACDFLPSECLPAMN